jgi:hypothetical protein
MGRRVGAWFFGGAGLVAATMAASAAGNAPPTYFPIDQGIDQPTLEQYHHTDQGTRLVPAAWLAALEMPDGSGKVMSPDVMRRYGFLVDNPARSPRNPYGWPVGWTVSDPAQTDGIAIAGFSCAMCHTGRIDYHGASMIIEGGQSMIDIFPFVDVVAEAFAATATDPVMRRKFFSDAVAAGYPAARMEKDFDAVMAGLSRLKQATPGTQITLLPGGPGRVDAVQGIANRAFGTDLMIPTNQRDGTAPVSYPYLWDIWRLSWLQYNGFLPIAPDSRNVGEVLGTIAETHMVDADGKLNPEPLRWKTSIQMQNLQWMEETLRRLRAPTWPEAVLGPIDKTKAERGRALFAENCAGCHGIKKLPDGNWDVAIVPLDHVGTDPNQATNWAKYTYDLTILGLGKAATAHVGTSAAINAMRKQAYVDAGIPAAKQEGDVTFLAPCGYKARPLIGVWATPPFLHNGSVRTVYDLLSDARPATFTYGTREYDPVKLGYTEDKGDRDAVLDTSVSGNRNDGHWWTDDTARPGRIGRKLSEDEKFALIEYLKAASYDNYPAEPRATEAAVACHDQPDWALTKAN